jgi:tetratricopeptide (TPR) repeat protein
VAFASTLAARLALVLHAQNRDDEALQFAQRSLEGAASDHVEAQTLWRRARARVIARRGALDEALRLAREAVGLASATDDVLSRGGSLLDLAEVLRLGGDAEAAVAPLEDALSLYTQKGNLVLAARAGSLLQELNASLSPAP